MICVQNCKHMMKTLLLLLYLINLTIINKTRLDDYTSRTLTVYLCN